MPTISRKGLKQLFGWKNVLFSVIALLLFALPHLVISDEEPLKMINTDLRQRLIYLRIQSMRRNNETLKDIISTKAPKNVTVEQPKALNEQSQEEKTNENFSSIVNFPNNVGSLKEARTDNFVEVSTSTVPMPIESFSLQKEANFSLLCLPTMPPPSMPLKFSSISEQESYHSPPIWLALLPHNGKKQSKDLSASNVHENDSSDPHIDSQIKAFAIQKSKRSYALTKSSGAYSTNDKQWRMERSPKFPILSPQGTVPSPTKIFQTQTPNQKSQLQIVHPRTPDEKNWVMAAGNESAVDGVLAISLAYGGRLVSMGYYHNTFGEIQYYAIMHRFVGPVFLKPDPISFSQLMKMARENEELDLALTQLCGQDDGNGKIIFNTYWERIPYVSFRIWFPGSMEAEKQRDSLENDGFRLVSICGYSTKGEARYVGVWQKPVIRVVPYEAHFGITLHECLLLDKKMRAKDYIATQFRVFNNGQDILCAAIWERAPNKKHYIEIGDNLREMYNKHITEKSRLPRQISHFVDVLTNRVKYVVLWSDLHSFRYPDPPDIWLNKPIPVSYLTGTEKQLDPAQLDFISKRVERFMRELDIPGLSVAISRNEQLKFAAGFGYGNLRRREIVNPSHQFRIGSVSKPITAAAILILVERKNLRLDQFVFGQPGSIFGNEFAQKRRYGRYITDITVRHLLEHTSGGWNNVDSDPAWLAPGKSTKNLIEQVIHEQPLISRPGKVWIYSNFGYQLLGFIIERVSGQTYEVFVKENIWQSVGVNDIQIAHPSLSEKSRREVLYYMSGNKVGFNPYDMLPPERTGPWGGWIASPVELLRLMSRLDGFKQKRDILNENSLKEWSQPTLASNLTYGLGWSLNIMGFNGWQHDGRMPGSASMLVRLDNGLEMAVVEYSERDFFHELGYILHHIGNNCNWWTDSRIDLFDSIKIS